MSKKSGLYTIEVEREVTFRHVCRVRATSENSAREKATTRVRAGDWFGGDVVNDWIRTSVKEVPRG